MELDSVLSGIRVLVTSARTLVFLSGSAVLILVEAVHLLIVVIDKN